MCPKRWESMSLQENNYTVWSAQVGLLRPILTFVVWQRRLAALVIMMEAEEEVRWSSIKIYNKSLHREEVGEDVWDKQALDVHPVPKAHILMT